MKTHPHLSMLDLVFQGRNKAYGAYVLRRAYQNNLLRALFFTCVGSVSLLFGSLAFQDLVMKPIITEGQVEVPDPPRIIEVNLEDPIPEKKPAKNPAPFNPAEESNHSNLVVITDSVQADHQVDTTITDPLNQGLGKGISDETDAKPETGNGGSGTDEATTTTPYLDVALDKRPEFEGGDDALLRLISQNVRYPSQAAMDGISGRVIVQFVVDEKGGVSDISICKSVSFQLDREAVRVVSKIPGFKSPGIKNGKPVKTLLRLPINFSLKH